MWYIKAKSRKHEKFNGVVTVKDKREAINYARQFFTAHNEQFTRSDEVMFLARCVLSMPYDQFNSVQLLYRKRNKTA